MGTLNIPIPEIPDRKEKEWDFAAIFYVLKSVARRTSPITEMVSHDIQFEYLSMGDEDAEHPKMKYSYLAIPSGLDDAGINELLRRAQRILTDLTNKIWSELIQYEEKPLNTEKKKKTNL